MRIIRSGLIRGIVQSDHQTVWAAGCCRLQGMTSRSRMDSAWLALVTALTRYLTRSQFLYDLDSVNFGLALDYFDPAAHQPHPPGYFLYVLLGRAVRNLTGENNSALVAISIAASCGLGVLIYTLGREWFGRQPALFAGLL